MKTFNKRKSPVNIKKEADLQKKLQKKEYVQKL